MRICNYQSAKLSQINSSNFLCTINVDLTIKSGRRNFGFAWGKIKHPVKYINRK